MNVLSSILILFCLYCLYFVFTCNWTLGDTQLFVFLILWGFFLFIAWLFFISCWLLLIKVCYVCVGSFVNLMALRWRDSTELIKTESSGKSLMLSNHHDYSSSSLSLGASNILICLRAHCCWLNWLFKSWSEYEILGILSWRTWAWHPIFKSDLGFFVTAK